MGEEIIYIPTDAFEDELTVYIPVKKPTPQKP